MLKKRYIKISVGKTGKQTIFESKMQPNSSRIDFEVKKYANGASYGMNTANVELYNISDETFRDLQVKENPILIEAGYEGEDNIIFNGRVSNVLKLKKSADSTDVVTTLFCSSGLKNIQQAVYTADFSKEAENSPTLEIKQFIINMVNNTKVANGDNINVDVVFINRLDGSQISGYLTPESFNDNILEIMKYLGSKFNFNFQIEESKIIIRPREIKPTIEIKPESGLLGIPEITELGVDIKIFLNPQIEAGKGFTLSSKFSNFKLGALEFLNRTDVAGTAFNLRETNKYGRYEGTYTIISLTHKGSSHTNEWQTNLVSQNYRKNYQSARVI